MKKICENEIAFVICTENQMYLEECMKYIDYLTVPEGYYIDVIAIGEVSSASEAYNAALEESSAKYKIYLKESTFLINRSLLVDLLELFKGNADLGMISVRGANTAENKEGKLWNLGKVIEADSKSVSLIDYQKDSYVYCEADNLDEIFLATQYDIMWEENSVDKNDYVEKQCLKYHQLNYRTGVAYQRAAWCLTERGTIQENQKQILQNIKEIEQAEKEKNRNIFCRNNHTEWLIEQYCYFKFLLRRIEYHFTEEDTQGFYEAFRNYSVSAEAVSVILSHEILWDTRVKHYIENAFSVPPVCACNAKAGKVMNIATSINRKYVLPTCVMLESIWSNHKEMPIEVYIMHNELLDEDKEIICSYAEPRQIKVHYIEVDAENFKDFYVTEMWSRECYYRLQLIEKLPTCVDRILYLDTDILVIHSITEFYFSDFEGNDIIGCKDMGSAIPFKDIRDEIFKEWVGSDKFAYCNAGMMLWNVEKLRGNVGVEDYLKVAVRYHFKMRAPDQDLINYVHAGKIKLVEEYKYDFFARALWDKKCEELINQTSIIHYSGPKPWSGKTTKIEIDKFWWAYAKNTPFYETFLEKVLEESYAKDKEMFSNCLKLDYARETWKQKALLKQKHPELAVFKDKYIGKRCFIIGNGPSLRMEDLNKLADAGEICFACNVIHKAYNNTYWRPDYLCVSDPLVLEQNYNDISKYNDCVKIFTDIRDYGVDIKGFPKAGEFLFYEYPGDGNAEDVEFSLDIVEGVHNGSTVVYMMLQTCIYMGFNEIYLLGIDFSDFNKHCIENYFEKRDKKINRPNVRHSMLAYQKAETISLNMGRKIYNATRGGKLEVFERVDFDELIVTGRKK